MHTPTAQRRPTHGTTGKQDQKTGQNKNNTKKKNKNSPNNHPYKHFITKNRSSITTD